MMLCLSKEGDNRGCVPLVAAGGGSCILLNE